MTQLFAQPYDISATGFYFSSADEYTSKSKELKNQYGDPVEEFEIQFIDGENIDAHFAKAFGLYQNTLAAFFEAVEELENEEKIKFVIAVGECGYELDADKNALNDLELEIYEIDTMRELAEQFVDDGLFGEVPPSFQNYIDYDAIARDLSIDYTETVIAGQHLIYRCG